MASFAELGPEDFPGLTKITGRLTATGGSLVKLELPALQVVEGNITILGSTTLEELRLPSLTTIGTVTSSAQTQLGQSSLKVIEAPALTSVHGELAIATAASLCSLNFRRVSQIDGAVQLFDLPNLPYSATSSIRGAARGAVTARNIGCCTFSDLFDCSTFTNRAACNASCE